MHFFAKSITNSSDTFLLQCQDFRIAKQVRIPRVGLDESGRTKNQGHVLIHIEPNE